jgi:hypothetical protein
LNHIDFRCPSTPTSAAVVTLLSAPNITAPNTDVVDEQVVTHGESVNENLTVICGTSTTSVTEAISTATASLTPWTRDWLSNT